MVAGTGRSLYVRVGDAFAPNPLVARSSRWSRPSASAIPDVSAVSVSPTWVVPVMVGAPAAGVLGLAATAAVAPLVSDSAFSASSVKDTFTLMALPSSLSVRV